MVKKTSDFFFEYFEKKRIPSIFSEIYYTQNKKTYTNIDYKEGKKQDEINSILFIPDYITPSLNLEKFKVKKINQFFKGYAIFLDGFNDVNEYLKFRFKKNSKSILKRIKRLEHCFSISYKFYYGEISKTEYDFYMSCLKEMLINRFKQRDDISQTLRKWDYYQDIFFSLINEKKASLFIIYNKEVPITISLSHHFNEKLFSAISSYNIDYAKFSLGNIEIYKKLEWCFQNNHNTYEMGMGDLSYKREWCNHIYNFEHQIIYPKKSIIATINAYKEYWKAQIKEFIYKLAYVRYKKFKSKNKKNINSQLKFKIININNTLDSKKYLKINYNSNLYLFLKKPVFDFLYSNQINEDDVIVKEISKSEKSYLILGKQKSQKIIFY